MRAGKNQKGMTLLEVVIAMFLFAMIVTTSNAFLVGFIKANASVKEMTKATQLGNEILESLRMTPYDAIVADTDTLEDKYKCSYLVNETKIDTNSIMKEITLAISWPADRPSHKIELSTIISNDN